jgi:hypothetical protein
MTVSGYARVSTEGQTLAGQEARLAGPARSRFSPRRSVGPAQGEARLEEPWVNSKLRDGQQFETVRLR